MLIKTMDEFREALSRASQTGDPFLIIKVIETIELRIRRIEHHLGIPMPRDLVLVRKIENRSSFNEKECQCSCQS